MIPIAILTYFNKMQPGDRITIAKAKDPAALTQAGKEYIEQGGNLEFSNDWKEIKKIEPYTHAN
jgi:hypothetical protein